MLSRRHFLQLLGASAAALTLDPIQILASPSAGVLHAAQAEKARFVGRTLTTTALYNTPTDAAPTSQLMSNTVHHILSVQDDWFQLAQGFVNKRNIQPIPVIDYAPPQSIDIALDTSLASANNTAISVIAPSAAIRSTAHASAALIDTIGHGGIMRAIDYLPPSFRGEVGWLGLSDHTGGLLGWSQAHLWAEVDDAHLGQSATVKRLEIEQSAHQLHAYEGDQLILSAPISHAPSLQPASADLTTRQLSIFSSATPSVRGIPYALNFTNGTTLSGAYWHNSFGASADTAQAIQVPVYIARWLYHWLPNNTPLVVR